MNTGVPFIGPQETPRLGLQSKTWAGWLSIPDFTSPGLLETQAQSAPALGTLEGAEVQGSWERANCPVCSPAGASCLLLQVTSTGHPVQDRVREANLGKEALQAPETKQLDPELSLTLANTCKEVGP